jgi:hypothetical protein
MDDTGSDAPWWVSASTAKARTAIQRSVTALLDELAPERAPRRLDRTPDVIEQHRTPTGCVLQATDCAVSVSWFADAGRDASLNELHIVVWRGTVARRGSPLPRTRATQVSDIVLTPVEMAPEGYGWLAKDGTKSDSAAVAARCLALLEEQIAR